MVENADEKILNKEQIDIILKSGQQALDNEKFEDAKEKFESIYNKNMDYKKLEIVDGFVRSLTNNLEEVNQEQECFKKVNELYGLAKKEGKQDICEICNQYFEFCKNKKEEEIFIMKLNNINNDIEDIKKEIEKIKTSDDLLIDKIKEEIQELDEERINEKDKSNKSLYKLVIISMVIILFLILSLILMKIFKYNNIILYLILIIIFISLMVLQSIKIKEINNNNRKYKEKIKLKKIKIKNIENRIEDNFNSEELKKINEQKKEILSVLEARKEDKKKLEKILSNVKIKIKQYRDLDKKIVNKL